MKRLHLIAFAIIIIVSSIASITLIISILISSPPPNDDSDGDGLSNADSDGDGLSNYEETIKYKTDSYNDDSDGDGIPDGNWDERREYVYTIKIEIKMRKPFDIESMNDLYQDVRVISGPDEEGYTYLEAIIYPETKPSYSPSLYPLEELPSKLEIYTEPGIATNYSAEMQIEVLEIVEGAENDVDVVKQVLQWVAIKTTYYLEYSIPEIYYTYLDLWGNISMPNYYGDLPVEELLRTHYFADSMFKERTHGTCTSIATLKCAMLKAAGIPCRLIYTIYPIYYHEDQNEPYINNLSRYWGSHGKFEYSSGEENAEWCNHGFIEVYLDGHWIRVDRTINKYYQSPYVLILKILSVSDWSEVDFSETWPVDWIHNRPYYTLSLTDQEPQH